jgi:hypothetical protein
MLPYKTVIIMFERTAEGGCPYMSLWKNVNFSMNGRKRSLPH